MAISEFLGIGFLGSRIRLGLQDTVTPRPPGDRFVGVSFQSFCFNGMIACNCHWAFRSAA